MHGHTGERFLETLDVQAAPSSRRDIEMAYCQASLDEKAGTFPSFAEENGRTGHYARVALLACLVSDVIVNGVMYITGQLTMS